MHAHVTELPPGRVADEDDEVHVHEEPKAFIWKHVFSTDHKVIGKQYFMLAVVSLVIGITLSLMFRYHLSTWSPQKMFLSPETYIQVLTMHGTILVFFVLTTAPLSGFGNYFLPIQIGAVDMAFPRLNMLSFWFTFVAFLIMMAAFVVPGGPPVSGWTGYPPLSAINSSTTGMGWGQSLWVLSIAVFCIASMLGAINFIVTTLDLRARGMSLTRMPLSVWSWFFTAIVALLTFSVLFAGGLLLLLDRHLCTSFYLPAGVIFGAKELNHKGGSPLLFQHLFWFFGHPEVYIIIMPAMGIVTQVISNFSRRAVMGYRMMIGCLAFISSVGMLVWGHHMFQSGMSPYTAVAFSVLTMAITAPSALKTLYWLGTLWGGKIRFTAAMLFALGFLSLFVTGGISGLFLGQNVVDVYFHDTYFVVAHFHIIMGVAALFATVAGTYFWFPKMYGRMLNETLGKLHFWLTFAGVYCVFIPMHIIGMLGHPRRYSGFEFELLSDPTIVWIHRFTTVAAFFTAFAQLIFLYNLFYSMFKGAKAADNPWEATTLEWATSSPPPFDNFGGKEPVVYHGAYEFSVPGAAKDFIMQNEPVAPPSNSPVETPAETAPVQV
ncbi:MAG: cbb3-type cytochrome c oxidase subunit I [Planctomycetes bacterium]|nr:cbb3-type cytochrome c oxidase subunit I [Planctomycetota bacterium]